MSEINVVRCGAIVVAALLAAGTAQVNAMQVDWENSSAGVALTLNGNTLSVPQGDLIEIGLFKNGLTPAQITALGPNPTTIQADFNVWVPGLVGDNTVADGAFSETSDAPGSGFFQANAFVVVFNASSAGSATQVAVIQGPTSASVGDNWIFPANDGAATPMLQFNALSAGNVLIGTYHGDNSYDDSYLGDNSWFGPDVNSIELAAVVPEPSTYILVSIGLLALWDRRPRRS